MLDAPTTRTIRTRIGVHALAKVGAWERTLVREEVNNG